MQKGKIILNLIYNKNLFGSFFSKILHLLFALLFISSPLTQNKAIAQQKDNNYRESLFNAYVALRSYPSTKQAEPAFVTENIKCGFSIAAEIKNNLSLFSAEQRLKLAEIMQRKQRDTSIVSPSGFFRIHFNLSGTEAPNYNPGLSALDNAMLVALAFDSSYNFEVNHLGYPPPPQDNAGPDNRYDVYITYPGSRTYGFTQPETSLGERQTTSYIELHYSFNEPSFYAKGIDAARVTAAHEFHHAITLGNYLYREEDRFFMEITSTSMEEFVFDEVNDYYGYMSHYFRNTSRVFSRFEENADAYDFAIWNIFLADTLGINIIKRQWELINNMRALDAINESLRESGTSFTDMMNSFGIWCFFTGYRTQSGMYFDEAERYPIVKTLSSTFNPGNPVVLGTVAPASNTYITIVNSSASSPDSITVAITNSNIRAAIETPGSTYQFQYTLYDQPGSGLIKLTDIYYFDFNPHDQFWLTTEMFPDQVIREGLFIPAETDFVFPSPFYYSKHNAIHIPVEELTLEESFLNVYSPSMNLVYSSPVEVKKQNQKEQVKWSALDNNGNHLPTGVYIYSLKMGDKVITGKIVIFNE